VSDFQAVQSLPELWRESVIRYRLVREQSIASRRWPIKNIQEGSTRWLLFIRYVRMPGNRVRPLFEEVSRRGVVSTSMDEMNLGIALRST